MLTRELTERMMDCVDAAEAVKLLLQIGYPEPEAISPQGIEGMLTQKRSAFYAELYRSVPDRRLVDIFTVKYDYHNVKVLLKEKYGQDEIQAQHLLMDCSRCRSSFLQESFARGELLSLPPLLAHAIEAAEEILSTSGDAQAADMLLDHACFAEMSALARDCGGQFLRGYVALLIDITNLRTLVRCARFGANKTFIERALLRGGTIAPSRLLSLREGTLRAALHGTPLAGAGELAAAAAKSDGMTAFEKACDDTLIAYVRPARRIAFGEEVPVAQLCAREMEWVTVRTVLLGKFAGLARETIAARLRDSYC